MTRTSNVRLKSDAATARPAAAPRAGQIGPWRLVRLAAEGGLAQVYQARPMDSGSDRPAAYALKLLKPNWHDNPEAVACVRREAQVGRSLACSNLVSILSSHTAGPPYYVVMPWLSGGTLAAHLRSGFRPAVPAALWIVRQTAQALKAMHSAGWMHADIKPGNIFLSPQMHVTVLDLGFARRTDEMASAADRCILGTVQYMAPELITSSHYADIRSDIYSLGVTLFELLTGRLPFEGREMGEIVRQHRECRPANVRKMTPAIPAEVARLLYDMLAKQPLRRPQSPAELTDRLVRLEVETLSLR